MTIERITVPNRPNIFWSRNGGEPIAFAGEIALWAQVSSLSIVTRFYPRACPSRKKIVLNKYEVENLNFTVGRGGRVTAIGVSDFDRLVLFLASRSAIAKRYTGGQIRRDRVMPTGCVL